MQKHSLNALTLRATFGLSALLAAAAGCAVDTSEAPEQSAESNLFLGAGVQAWSTANHTVPLCWYTQGYAREKAIIQAAIQRTWVSVANINATWREGCPTTGTERFVVVQIGRHGMVPDGQGGMYYDHSTDGQTRGLGMAALSSPTTTPASLFGTAGMTFWVEDNGTSAAPRMEYVAVHEFGHVLGFPHEQERAEQEARACGPVGSGGTTLGPYDPESVMNYCNHYYNGRGILSEGDIAGARQLYGVNGDRRNLFADLTGDGRADGIAVNTNGNYVALSTGTALGAVRQWSGAFYGSRDTLVGDVNGDRRADAIAVNNAGLYVLLSNGSALTSWRAWLSVPFYGTRRTLAGDLNGDGRADLVAINHDSVYVTLSNGSTFGAPRTWTTGAFFGTIATYLADVNGDGRADLIAVGGLETRVRLSTGASFAAATRWSGPFYGQVASAFADVNGDRRADAIAVNDDRVYVMLSSGTAFTGYAAWSSIPFYGTRDTLFADVTGDGRADAVAVNNGGDYVLTSTGSALVWSGQWSGPFYSQR